MGGSVSVEALSCPRELNCSSTPLREPPGRGLLWSALLARPRSYTLLLCMPDG